MSALAPILLIEDDPDDLYFFQAAYSQITCGRPLKWFQDPIAALDYLKATKEMPYLIVADINMPKIDGMALRTLMRETKVLALRATPFFFLTTSAGVEQMRKGFELMVQGFFIKPVEMPMLVEVIRSMVEYAARLCE